MISLLCTLLLLTFPTSMGAEETKAAPSLGELAQELSGRDGNARRKAAEAIAAYPTPEAVNLLAQAYRAESLDAFGVKAACAAALGRTGRPEAAAPLAEMLSDTDYWVRKKAVEALGNIPGEAATKSLATALTDPDPRVRAGAALSLGSKTGQAAVLLRTLEDPDAAVAGAALEALDHARAPEAPALLTKALESPDPHLRYRAASLLARRGDRRGLEVLAEAIRSGREAGSALREASCIGQGAVPLLIQLFSAPGAGDKDAIFDALEKLECADSSDFFADLALRREAPAELRVRAASALFDRRDTLTPKQVEKSAGLLAEASPDLLAVSLQILVDRGSQENLTAIAPLAVHENQVVRHFALQNLAKYGGPQYESAFVAALSDKNGANVRLALEALGRVGTRASLPSIRPLSQDRMLRRYAEAAVEAIEARP